jgi:hypothetical protein
VKFWDTSAIVSLCVAEPLSPVAKEILTKDPSIAVWWATRTECVAALARRLRDHSLTTSSERQARHVLHILHNGWTEVQPSESLRAVAERLLSVHPLKAADSLQLAAAFQWSPRETAEATVVSFDLRLRDAAHREGFSVEPPEIN